MPEVSSFKYNRIGSFVDEQVARLEQAVNGLAKDLKFVLYSGHDTTCTSPAYLPRHMPN